MSTMRFPAPAPLGFDPCAPFIASKALATGDARQSAAATPPVRNNVLREMLILMFQTKGIPGPRTISAQPPQARIYQISFKANCNWRFAAAVLLIVLNSPNVGVPPDV